MKLCLFFNTPSIYREAIYKAIDSEYDCDWYFGDNDNGVRSFDTSSLKSVKYLKVGNKGKRIYWTKGLMSLLFKKEYKTFFMYGPTWDLSFWSFLLLKRTIFRRKKVNIWVHGWYGKESRIESRLKKFMYDTVDGIFCYGDRARKLLLDMGYDRNKVFAIHNSLNYDEQKQLREKQVTTNIYRNHFGNEYPTLIFLGRLTPVKQLNMFLDAVAILRTKGKYFNVILVGDGPMYGSLLNKATELGLLEHIWFYGACYDESTNAELVYNADLCVAPGNVGLTAMHTMMFGCPVVTHNDFAYQMPEYEAVKPHYTGCFFKRGDVNSLADKIEEWFTINGDKREEIRKCCYQEIDKNWNPYYQMKVIKENLILCRHLFR